MSKDPEIDRLMDALEMAWGLIANAGGGDWDKESDEWQDAATRFRDEHWHPALERNGYTTIGREELQELQVEEKREFLRQAGHDPDDVTPEEFERALNGSNQAGGSS